MPRTIALTAALWLAAGLALARGEAMKPRARELGISSMIGGIAGPLAALRKYGRPGRP